MLIHKRYSSDPRPFAAFGGLGERLPDNTIRLPERAYAFDPSEDVSLNAFVRVEVDGEEIHFEKLKRDSSTAIGLERDGAYTYFLDKIRPR